MMILDEHTSELEPPTSSWHRHSIWNLYSNWKILENHDIRMTHMISPIQNGPRQVAEGALSFRDKSVGVLRSLQVLKFPVGAPVIDGYEALQKI